jgi:urease accessory protein
MDLPVSLALNAPCHPATLLPASARAHGAIRASFARSGERSCLAGLYEAGGLRLRFPRNVQSCEAVIVNTGGGVIGGDSATLAFRAGTGCDVTLTTQSAEKIYRAQQAPAQISLDLAAEQNARLEWLPQETILFEGAKLKRSFALDAHESARVTLLEATIFGRLAMGEVKMTGFLSDRWRLRRAGRLCYADDLLLQGEIGALLDRQACGAGARATALLLHLAPDAESLLEPVRECLASATCAHGASAWNGMLAIRLLSPAPETMRAALAPLLHILRGRPAPRVWQ